MSQHKPFTQAALKIFTSDVTHTHVRSHTHTHKSSGAWALDMGRGVKDIQLLDSTALI